MDLIPFDSSRSSIIPIYKKGQNSTCDDHRGVSLTNIVSKVLVSVILRRLIGAHEEQTEENQASFIPGRGCIDQILTFLEIWEHRHALRRPTIVAFVNLKGAVRLC